MSVPEQLPIVSYIANGATTSFAITFDLHDDKYLLVTKNKELMPVGSYSIQDGSVIFGTAPITGDEITLARDTQLDRETNFKSYDNSFRPESINWDLDKLWHVLQEQNLIDAKILARIKEEIEWRRTHDVKIRDEIAQEVHERRTLDLNYDTLAQVRDLQVFGALKQYLDTILASTNPNIFGGVTAGVVFALDKKSIQTHIEEILDNLLLSRKDIDSKATQVYVDDQLNLKAPLTKTNELELKKADLEYVNTIVSAASEGIIPFQTQAELLLFKPTQAKALAKALDTRKEYLWKRTSEEGEIPVEGDWIETDLSDLDLAKKYTDESLVATENHILDLNLGLQLNAGATSELGHEFDQNIENQQELYLGLHVIANSISQLIKSESENLKSLMITQNYANEVAKLDGFDPDLSNGITQTIDGLYTLPEPRSLVKINLITSDIIPAAKGDVKNGNVTIDIDGQILRTACQYEVQGSSSALYPKKNLTFGFFTDENYEDEVLVKIGELLPHQELVFKANWIDHTHTRNTGANRIWEQMQHSRKANPLRDIDHSYEGLTGLAALDTGALGHVKGYACVVYVNDDFYGLGDLNIGKKRQNYNLPKNKPEKIFLELNHWTEISVLDTVNTGWNGSQIVEFKTPSTVTAQTQTYVQQLRDFSLLAQSSFNSALVNKLDKNNIIDFMLFADFVATTDLVTPNSNEIKNANLISWNGTKWFFMPYDLDTVFGLRYDGTMIDVQPTTSFMNGTFWTKIKTAYMADIEARYAELRANIFTVNNVAITLRDLTSKYSTELYTAELAKWPTLPSINITSMTQILEWTSARITYLDSKYNFSS